MTPPSGVMRKTMHRPVAILKPGVIGHIRSCEAASDWCQVQTGEYRGYLKRSQLWGVLPAEVVTN